MIIEHNLDVIKTADYIIDIGPDGGDRGGTIVACGTPEEIAQVEESYTGKYIKRMLDSAKEDRKIIPVPKKRGRKKKEILEVAEDETIKFNKNNLKELCNLWREVRLTQRNRTLKNTISQRLNHYVFSEIS